MWKVSDDAGAAVPELFVSAGSSHSESEPTSKNKNSRRRRSIAESEVSDFDEEPIRTPSPPPPEADASKSSERRSSRRSSFVVNQKGQVVTDSTQPAPPPKPTHPASGTAGPETARRSSFIANEKGQIAVAATTKRFSLESAPEGAAARSDLLDGLRNGTAVPPVLPVPAQDLPPGWTEHFEKETGRPYYHNSATKKTQWERPQEKYDLRRASRMAAVATKQAQADAAAINRRESQGNIVPITANAEEKKAPEKAKPFGAAKNVSSKAHSIFKHKGVWVRPYMVGSSVGQKHVARHRAQNYEEHMGVIANTVGEDVGHAILAFEFIDRINDDMLQHYLPLIDDTIGETLGLEHDERRLATPEPPLSPDDLLDQERGGGSNIGGLGLDELGEDDAAMPPRPYTAGEQSTAYATSPSRCMSSREDHHLDASMLASPDEGARAALALRRGSRKPTWEPGGGSSAAALGEEEFSHYRPGSSLLGQLPSVTATSEDGFIKEDTGRSSAGTLHSTPAADEGSGFGRGPDFVSTSSGGHLLSRRERSAASQVWPQAATMVPAAASGGRSNKLRNVDSVPDATALQWCDDDFLPQGSLADGASVFNSKLDVGARGMQSGSLFGQFSLAKGGTTSLTAAQLVALASSTALREEKAHRQASSLGGRRPSSTGSYTSSQDASRLAASMFAAYKEGSCRVLAPGGRRANSVRSRCIRTPGAGRRQPHTARERPGGATTATPSIGGPPRAASEVPPLPPRPGTAPPEPWTAAAGFAGAAGAQAVWDGGSHPSSKVRTVPGSGKRPPKQPPEHAAHVARAPSPSAGLVTIADLPSELPAPEQQLGATCAGLREPAAAGSGGRVVLPTAAGLVGGNFSSRRGSVELQELSLSHSLCQAETPFPSMAQRRSPSKESSPGSLIFPDLVHGLSGHGGSPTGTQAAAAAAGGGGGDFFEGVLLQSRASDELHRLHRGVAAEAKRRCLKANQACPFSHETMDSSSTVDLRCGHRFALERLGAARRAAERCYAAGFAMKDALICPLCGDQDDTSRPGLSGKLRTYSANTDAYLGDLRKDWQLPLKLPMQRCGLQA
eukprot:TRINITY_DN80775_c0_g1_i1.p1 TRINITY_DN80775_c0_g1~~TRINITY_DN80775_c0_g1_i1.p1  ORF type:complete len:1074 (+),score=239.21 TRINITY_DN80775_c0_g1_i1:206-3427(+)